MTPETNTITEWLANILGPDFPKNRLTEGYDGEVYVRITDKEFERSIPLLAAYQFSLIGLFGVEEFGVSPGTSLLYVFEKTEHLLILVPGFTSPAPSIARLFSSAAWFERECRDGFGAQFTDAFDTRRLLLHETYPDGFYPLLKSCPNEPIETKLAIEPEEEYPFRTLAGDGVYQVPVGPVHAGVIESGHFRFSVIGERIFNLEVRMFFKHRGIEKLAEGMEAQSGVKIAEAVSGEESMANATALCIAAERISVIVVPDRAWYLRTILLEMERIISHLGDQAGMLTDIAFPFGASRFAVLREEMMRMNARITGSRFLRGIMKVGGLERDISFEDLNILADFCDLFRGRYRALLRIALTNTSVIDRFTPTGIVSRDLIVPLALSGPTARASGSMNDTRVQHPYGIYDRYIPEVKTLHEGDVLARFTLKAEEIIASLDIIDRLIREMPEGPVSVNAPVADGYSLALVESARGQNMCWLWIRDGKIWRYKVRTASFCNWQAIEHAVQNEILPDFPLINKSFNFSYAGTDL